VKRGEIWTVAGGSGYAGKPRPAVIVQTDMFDAETEERVYTVESRTDFAEATSEIILGEARELAKRLRKDKLVR
jgi:mRNA-degrading endonuclease toxin of MazEF toxin-antitoxin module